MSIPNSATTGCGREGYKTELPETFLIVFLVLNGILRRNGYIDAQLYAKHNNKQVDTELFDSGVIFNLFSVYGVGKVIEPMVVELFKTWGLDPDRYEHDIFFQEIVRLTPEVSRIIRKKNLQTEADWMCRYAMDMIYINDSLMIEREDRLFDIIQSDQFDQTNNMVDVCACDFCEEFNKYHQPYPNRDLIAIINQVMNQIIKD